MGKYCPICGAKLSLNGRRMLKCKGCGLIVDRDVIGAWNIRLRGLEKIDVASSVSAESLPMKPEGGKETKYYKMLSLLERQYKCVKLFNQKL